MMEIECPCLFATFLALLCGQPGRLVQSFDVHLECAYFYLINANASLGKRYPLILHIMSKAFYGRIATGSR